MSETSKFMTYPLLETVHSPSACYDIGGQWEWTLARFIIKLTRHIKLPNVNTYGELLDSR